MPSQGQRSAAKQQGDCFHMREQIKEVKEVAKTQSGAY
jgi:hypothetical protein